MNDRIKGENGSYFHNNLLISRPEDNAGEIALIDAAATDDIICRLNGYAILPVEEYYRLKGDVMPIGDDLKIKDMRDRLNKI